MSYSSNAWTAAECPVFSGRVVADAVPGCWDEMGDSFRAAGITDDFVDNPHFLRQSLPLAGGARDTTIPGILGCFMYRRTVELRPDVVRLADSEPIDAGNSRCVIAFDCVRNNVRVWINGKFVGHHEGFSTPFEIAVPHGILKEGNNEIVMSVSNGPIVGCYGAEVSGLATRGLFAAAGGIVGRMELRFLKNGLADVYVTTAADLNTFTVHLGGYGNGKRQCAAWEICKDGKVVAKGEAHRDFSLPTDGFEFWSPERPSMYTLRITTSEGVYSQKFGLRRLVAVGEKLRLNGKPVYLRGVTEHCYFPETVRPPRDIDYYRRLTARRRELGFNFVRFHTWVPPEEYLSAMDELGILVHIESPNFTPLEEYRSIIAFARRHPCVVIYCTGNETRIDRKAEAYLEDIARFVHSGTDALFSPLSAMRGVEYMLVDGKDDVASTPFRHNPKRMARLAAFCDLFTSYQQGAVSYDSLNGTSAATIDAWSDAYCGKPRLSHEICIDGSYADLSIEREYPEDSPILKAGVFSEIRRALDEKGLLGRAPAYYRSSCEWMRRIRKFTFEKMRSSRRTAGYDFLGDINSHWHTFGYCVGIMDEFLRLKPGETAENVRRYNSAAVLLSDLGSDFNVCAGDRKSVGISISNYAADVTNGLLSVELVDCNGNKELFRKRENVGEVECGDLKNLYEFDVEVPDENRVRKYILRAKFSSAAVSAENEWELYAFPRVRETAIPEVRNLIICGDISRGDLLAAMKRGERVLILGVGPFKSLPTTYRIGLAGRCSGNYATVIQSGHPALDGLPHEGFCGWQFRRLMEGGRAVQLEADVPFDPIVDIASSEKFPIRQSALFEYWVGEGRLIVCSFAFRDNDPAAVWLKARLKEYAASDAFNPRQTLTPLQLAAVMDAPLLTGEGNANKARNPNDPASVVRAGELSEP